MAYVSSRSGFPTYVEQVPAEICAAMSPQQLELQSFCDAVDKSLKSFQYKSDGWTLSSLNTRRNLVTSFSRAVQPFTNPSVYFSFPGSGTWRKLHGDWSDASQALDRQSEISMSDRIDTFHETRLRLSEHLMRQYLLRGQRADEIIPPQTVTQAVTDTLKALETKTLLVLSRRAVKPGLQDWLLGKPMVQALD